MDGISGSAHSLINLGIVMSQSRVQSLAEDHAGFQVDLIV